VNLVHERLQSAGQACAVGSRLTDLDQSFATAL